MADEMDQDEHVDDLLAAHFMGALDPAERDAVHNHLDRCSRCRASAEETIEVVAALALLELPDEDENDAGEREHVPLAASSPSSKPSSGHPRGRKEPTKSAPGRATTGPERGKRRRNVALLRAGALLVLAIVLGGLAINALTGPSDPPRQPQLVSSTGKAVDGVTGAAVTVYVNTVPSGVAIRATVSGLHRDTAYILYAVTADGKTWAVANWPGAPTVRDVDGQLPVALSDLKFFTVTKQSGGTVVSVYLPGTPGAAPTR